MYFFIKQAYWDRLVGNYKDFKNHNGKTGNNRMDFEFENEMNNIFGDDPIVVPHFTLDLLNKKRIIDVIDLVEGEKENIPDVEIEIKKEITNQSEKKSKTKKQKSNTTTAAIDIGNNMIEILLRQEEKKDEHAKQTN